jgi:predicted nucleic acid-binding protein
MPVVNEVITINTGPLIALAACDGLDLLRHLHRQVLVPSAVVEEFGRGGSGAAFSMLPPWFDIRTPSGPMPPILVAHLDHGEAAAIALAIEAGVGLVAIDERRGRLVAREMGLTVTGSLGVLLRAKRLGFIDAVGPRVAAMRKKGIWLGDALMRRVLLEAHESDAVPGEVVP